MIQQASVKDRLAIDIIVDTERRGMPKPGQNVVEAISGNTREHFRSTPLFEDVAGGSDDDWLEKAA